MNQFFLNYDGGSRRCKFIVYIDAQGTPIPLIRAQSIEACEQFIRLAKGWSNWDWALKLVHPTLQIAELHRKLLSMNPVADYDRDISQYGFISVADIITPIVSYTPPNDGISLEDWADSIFFSDGTATEVVKSPQLMEYHSRDHEETFYAPIGSSEYPNVRIANAVVVVDFDGDWRAIEYNGIPTPSKIIINPDNGHAHLWWLVNGKVKGKAVQWLDDITRGFTRRLNGDMGIHRYTKNPDYPGWQVITNDCTYELSDLDAVLSKEDKRRVWVNNSYEFLDGRNPRDFEKYRHIAYNAPVISVEDCEQYLWDMGQSLGYESSDREFRNICHWIAKGVEQGKWPEYATNGVPRRTYFRRKKNSKQGCTVPSRHCRYCRVDISDMAKQARCCSDYCRKRWQRLPIFPKETLAAYATNV